MASKIDQLKALIGSAGIARTYNWAISIPELPSLVVSNLAGNLATGFEITNLDLFCRECPLPQKEVPLIEVAVKYQTFQVNGRPNNFGSIAPTFLIDGAWDIYKVFRAWADLGASNREDAQLNEAELQVTAYIIALNGAQDEVLRIELRRAWCTLCPELTFNSDSAVHDGFAPTIAYDDTAMFGIPDGIPL